MTGLRMSAMNVGPLSVDANHLVAFAPGHLRVPTTAAVILHPTHGVVVWDTGINDAVSDPERREAYWGSDVTHTFDPSAFRREHAIDAQLNLLGIKPKDVRYVVYSHLHLDHAGGMSYFPNAVHVVQRDEIRYALWPDRWTSPVYCQNDFRDIRRLDILEIDGDFDLFEDGTLRLLKTPGHSPGHQALIVDLPHRGRVCMGADTGNQRNGFDALVPMPWDWNTSAMSMTRMRMRQLERSGIPVFLCHDAGDFDQLPRNGEFWD
jgi:N-acyl homoserine lactone hydrolase